MLFQHDILSVRTVESDTRASIFTLCSCCPRYDAPLLYYCIYPQGVANFTVLRTKQEHRKTSPDLI